MDYRKPNFIWLFVFAVLSLFLLTAMHEAGHWAVYQLFGRGPLWGFTSLVQMWEETPLHPQDWVQTVSPDGEKGWLHLASEPGSIAERVAMLAAGPLVTLLAVVAGLALARLSKNSVIQPISLLFSLAGAFNFGQYYLRDPFRSGMGDELFIASYLNIPKAALDLPMGLALLVCFVLALRMLPDWKTGLKWMAAILPAGPLVGWLLGQANDLVQVQVNLGNPFFQSVLGYSLPVFVFNSLLVIGLVVYIRQRSLLERRKAELQKQ